MNRLAIAFWALFCGAAAVYSWRLGALAFTTDEIYHGIAARAILETGKPLLPDGGLYLKGALFSYAGALFSQLFGSIEFGVRFASVLSVLLTGVILRKYCDDVSDRRTGLLASFIWYVHPWTIEFARWGRLYTLAALLLSAGMYFLCRFDQRGTRAQLVWSMVFLVLATIVYPFSIVGFLGVAVYWGARVYQRDPTRARAVLAVGGTALVLLVSSFVMLAFWGDAVVGLLERHGSFSLAAFTGHSGRAEWSIRHFFGFEGFYLAFFVTDLFPFAASAAALAVACALRPPAESKLRQVLALLGCLVAGLLLVTFFHLQTGAPRYLFPSLPLAVLATALFWATVTERFPQRAQQVYCGAAGCFLALSIWQGGTRAPFREYGDPYPHRRFAPTPTRSTFANFKSTAEYVKDNARPGDVVIASKHAFYFFYAREEPHYDLEIGKLARGEKAMYMSKTKSLRKCRDLGQALKKHFKQTRWLMLNDDARAADCVRRLSAKHRFVLRFEDPRDPTAKVYSVQPARRKKKKT